MNFSRILRSMIKSLSKKLKIKMKESNEDYSVKDFLILKQLNFVCLRNDRWRQIAMLP